MYNSATNVDCTFAWFRAHEMHSIVWKDRKAQSTFAICYLRNITHKSVDIFSSGPVSVTTCSYVKVTRFLRQNPGTFSVQRRKNLQNM